MNATLRTLAASAAFAAATATADTYTWTGASSAVWNKTDANWDKGVWVDGNVAVFPSGVSNKDITLGADVTVSGLQLAGDWSLGGAHTITLRVASGNFQISQTSRASLKLKDGISVSVNSACENNINRLDIENASFLTASGIRFHNGWNNGNGLSGGATISVGDRGVLGVYEFVHSPSTSAADADIYRVNVMTGGTFRLNHVLTQYNIDITRYGTLCFDGGKLEVYLDSDNHPPFSRSSDTIKLLVGPGGMHVAGDYALYLRSLIGSSGGGEDGGVWIETGKLVRMFNDSAPQQGPVNTFTGPVHMNQGGAIIIINSDRNLGAVPAEPKNGIVFDKWGRILSQGNVVIHENRNILLNSDATAVIATGGADATLAVQGTISGDAPGTARNGTLSTDSDFSGGAISIEPPAGRTNSIGRLHVAKKSLTIGGEGVTEITDAVPSNSVRRDGVLAVMEGASLNVTGGVVRVMAGSQYTTVDGGCVNVSGGLLDLSRQQNYLNAFGGAATTTVSRAGTLWVKGYYLSDSQTDPEGGLTRLQTGGRLLLNSLYLPMANGLATTKAQIDFDGGILAPLTADRAFLGNNPEWYTNVLCMVREGGAVISNNVEIWTRHPFLSGAEHDGGLHKWGTASLATITGEHTFNGPVEVHQGTLVWGNDYNYPVGTTLVVHEGATALLNLYHQTVARVEGGGTVVQCPYLAVAEAIAPGLGANAPGTLTFQDTLTLDCDLELDPGDTLKVASGQDISGIRLKLVDASAFDKEAPNETYKILDAPGGYTGTFNVGSLSDMWHVKYRANAAYLVPLFYTMMIFR